MQVSVVADIKVSALLRDKLTHKLVLTVEKYLTPFVILDAATAPTLGPQDASYHQHDIDSNVQPMDIGAILEVSKTASSMASAPAPVIAAGFDMPLTRRSGLLRMGLELSLSKSYLYPTQLVSALVV